MKVLGLILFQYILALKNYIKIGLAKYLAQVIIGFLGITFFIYYVFYYINDILGGFYLTKSINFFSLTKTLYNEMGGIIVFICFSILIISYKDSQSKWNKLKLYIISSEKFFISSIIFNFMLSITILSFIILTVAYTLKVNLILTFLFILFFSFIIFGNLILTIYVYKLINLKFRGEIIFFITSGIVLILIYLIDIKFLNFNSFENNDFINYILINIPGIVGIFIALITKKYSIRFKNKNEKRSTNLLCFDVFNNIKNPYIALVIIETCRNFKYYMEFLIIPYSILFAFNMFNIKIDYSSLILTISFISAIPMGLYYSYNDSHKVIPINYKTSIITRVIFSIIIVSINYFILMCIDLNLNSFSRYIDCLLTTLFITLFLNIIKISLLRYGKEEPLFYIITCLIPSIYRIGFKIVNKIINNYMNVSLNINIVTFILNIFMLLYIIIYDGSER